MAQWLDTFFRCFDESVLCAIHRFALATGGVFDRLMRFVSLLGNHGIFPVLLCLLLIFFRTARKSGICALSSICFGALITNVTLKNLVLRLRPFERPDGFFLSFWQRAGAMTAGDTSFPSGHTTVVTAFALGVFFCSANKKKTWPVLLAIPFMAFSRMYLMLHYPSDILGGLFCGTLAALLGLIFTRVLYRFSGSAPKPLGRFLGSSDPAARPHEADDDSGKNNR